ncbi:DMT family protein [Falsiroseomonas oryziterrae]|uniref:DMT family protein n=1 Tax=Falsiroseomonas oryziterrae TaxID=2911368 RepID=UPI001F37787B|nr:DMT family protein [Roseomonas sp. NPKOSM-4]
MNALWLTPLLLLGSNILMTFAWYGHLKAPSWPMWVAILVSWGIAFFEYCLAVPANRIGYGTFSAQQLKVMQEVITLAVFAVFAVLFLGEQLRWNFFAAGACLVAAVIFIFLPVE